MSKTSILTLALAAIPCAATAGQCIKNDAWTGPDKTKHVLVGAAIGSAATLATSNPHYGFALGTAVGIAKELKDRRGGGTCSLQDGVMTALGAAAGAYGTAFVVAPTKNGVFVGYSRSF